MVRLAGDLDLSQRDLDLLYSKARGDATRRDVMRRDATRKDVTRKDATRRDVTWGGVALA